MIFEIKTVGDLMALLIVSPVFLLMIYGAYLFLKDKEGRSKIRTLFTKEVEEE